MWCFGPCPQVCDVVHLEGAQTQLDEDPSLSSCVFREEAKHHVVHPEQGDEQQRGLGQPPAGPARASEPGCWVATAHFVSHLKWLASLPPTLGDLSFCTRMRITLMKMRKFTYTGTSEGLTRTHFWKIQLAK